MHTPESSRFKNKVYIPLAKMLPQDLVDIAHVDRYSLLEADGIVTQIAMTTGRFSTEAAVRAYVSIDPADKALWDPSNLHLLQLATATAAKKEGLTGTAIWVRGRDVHPDCSHNEIVAAIILIGTTLFVRATTSAVKRAIYREDGADENVYTVLLSALVRHYRMGLMRWDEDITRATRDDLSSASLIDTCIDPGTLMQFGPGQQWDPRIPESRHILTMMLGQGSVDDGMRRRKLMGKRIQKLHDGGWPWAEAQLPHGFRVQRDAAGDIIKVVGKGKVPQADWDMAQAVKKLWRLHAKGTSYVALGEEMARLGIQRRGQKKKGVLSFPDLVSSGNRTALGLAAKSFFVNAKVSPREERDVYLQKVELMRTGIYRTHVDNEIRGRAFTVSGLAPISRHEGDEFGYFDVTVNWGFPVNPRTGKKLVRFGLTLAEVDASRARLISEIGKKRKKTGGAGHQRQIQRAIRPGSWADAEVEYGTMARMTNAGKFTDVVLSAPAAERRSRGHSGWGYELDHPATYAIATYALSDLCGSVSTSLKETIASSLRNEDLATFVLSHQPVDLEKTRRDARLAKLEAEKGYLPAKIQQHKGDAKALNLSAARALELGDTDKRDRLDLQSDEEAEKAATAERRLATIEEEIAMIFDDTDSPGASVVRVKAELTLAAYMVDGLRRASDRNGLGPATLAEVTDEHLVAWRLDVGTGNDGVTWHCTAIIPLAGGSTARLALSGVIDNVRLPQGGRHESSPKVLARQLFLEGRTMDDVIQACHVSTSRKALMTKRVMPFLRDNGVTALGAKNALVDHPVRGVQQVVYGHISSEPVDSDAWPAALRLAITDYYFDPDAEGGFAACLDDTVLAQRVLTTLALHDPGCEGILAEHLALGAGCSGDDIRDLAAPIARTSGPKRPLFLETHSRHRVRLMACTHCPTKFSAVADRVLYLGEVARSGYGVVCGTCGRVPVPRSSPDYFKWSRVVFGVDFTGPGLITRIARTTLREEPQSGFVPMPPPLALPRAR